ncbi:hypothetical protein AVEN_9997-1 [Araneus ventricosus]|uniref:Uncharacterized protein n=1 Tax=Araneus ventricosus TaxID=182803 RepID=A0A4Y2LGW0_ARAVE|nr:hypothetical protein AVEN_9997-1 [Araneus ventricosus]
MRRVLSRSVANYLSDTAARREERVQFSTAMKGGDPAPPLAPSLVLGAIDCTHVAIVGPPDDGNHHEKTTSTEKAGIR